MKETVKMKLARIRKYNPAMYNALIEQMKKKARKNK